MAVPELTPGAERTFVRQGAYAMIRHPRYLILMIGALFVVQDGRPVGIVHFHDFLRAGVA